MDAVEPSVDRADDVIELAHPIRRHRGGKVIYYFAQSLDGFLADGDGGLEWLFRPAGGGVVPDAVDDPHAYEHFFAAVGALAMGSQTYVSILDGGRYARWPYGDTPTWVFTSRHLRRWPGADIRFVDGHVGPVVEQMRQVAGDRTVWLVGGGRLASQFAAAGLLDELDVSVMPVALGTGTPVFSGRLYEALTLTAVDTLTDGSVRLRYEARRTDG